MSKEKAEYEKELNKLLQLERKEKEIDVAGFKFDWKTAAFFSVLLVAFLAGWKLRNK